MVKTRTNLQSSRIAEATPWHTSISEMLPHTKKHTLIYR